MSIRSLPIHFWLVAQIMMVVSAMFALFLFPAIYLAYIDPFDVLFPFLVPLAVCLLFTAPLISRWVRTRINDQRYHARDASLAIVVGWVWACALATMPLYLSPVANLSLTDAIFEAVSGVTTTGATVMTNLDLMPQSLLMFRQELQWLGGMGLVLFAVVVIPFIGGAPVAQLYRMELAGPIQADRVSPRISVTFTNLLKVYAGLTAACGLAYYAAGMSGFDAAAHALSTISIGGFSTHDANIGHFNSGVIEAVTLIFVVIGSTSFALHVRAITDRSPRAYLQSLEFRFMIGLLLVVTTLCVYLILSERPEDMSVESAIRVGVFQSISIATTTGYTTTTLDTLPEVAAAIMMMATFVGCCTGSAGGGIKGLRILVLAKEAWGELRRLAHPSSVFRVSIGRAKISSAATRAVLAFVILYLFTYVGFVLVVAVIERDFGTALGTVTATLNNLGPSVGMAAENYTPLSSMTKMALAVAMIMGRLEVLGLLTIFTRAYWRN